MFRIKICGITTVEDARMVAAAGADAVGLNFCPQSPRHIALETARRIAECLPASAVKVGLFVNPPAARVLTVSDQLGLDLIQLHGDEPPEFLRELEGRRVVRAFRVGAEGLRPMLDYLERCRRLACLPQLCLVDSYRKGQYGGTGQVADWSLLGGYAREGAAPPLVLAGGLTPENVAEAIQAVHPYAVDTASGVESSPGRKDPELVERFVAAARTAFERMPPTGT